MRKWLLILLLAIPLIHAGLLQPPTPVDASGDVVLATGTCTNAAHTVVLTDGSASVACTGTDFSPFIGEWLEWFDSTARPIKGFIGSADGKIYTTAAAVTQNWQWKHASYDNNDASNYRYRIIKSRPVGDLVASGTLISSDVRLATVDGGTMLEIANVNLSDTSDEDWVKTLAPVAWWKADDLADANGTAIATWTDKMATYNATQGTAGYRPKVIENCIGTRKCLRFDGSDDWLRYSCPITGTGSFTIISISKMTGGLGGKVLTGGGSESVGFYAHQYQSASQGGNKWISAWGSAKGMSSSINDYDTSSFHIGVSIYNNSDFSHKTLLDGKLGTVVTNPPASNLSATGYWGIGNAGSIVLGQYRAGDISEIIIFNTALTNTQRMQVERYLSSYYGIALTGPNTVPTGGFAGGDDNASLPCRWQNLYSTSAAQWKTNRYLICLYSSGGSACGYAGGPGAGIAVGSDVLSGWDFTSGWEGTVCTATVSDANTFAISAASGCVYKTYSALDTGKLYYATLEGTPSAGTLSLRGNSSEPIWCTGNSCTGYGTATTNTNDKVMVYNSAGGVGATADITSMTLQPVTDIGITGIHLHSTPNAYDRKMARVDSGFNPNAVTSYKIYQIGPSGFDLDVILDSAGYPIISNPYTGKYISNSP